MKQLTIFLISAISILLTLGIYYYFRDHQQISEEVWTHIELDRSKTLNEKEKREYLILIMFQQVGISLSLIIIPLIFSLHQNVAVRKRTKRKVTAFNDILKSKVNKESLNFKHMSLTQLLTKNYPDLSPNELKLCDLLHQNLSSKEIAEQLNITHASVNTARYRLRKKLNLSNHEDLIVFLNQFMNNF